MKRFPLILLSLLLIAACAVSFAEEAPWVTMENVREHSGNVWREEIPHYNGAEEQGFQPLAMDPAEAWQRLRVTGVRTKQHASCFNPGESKWSPAERLCFGSLSARQTFSIMGIQIFQPRMCRWCRSSVFPDGAGGTRMCIICRHVKSRQAIQPTDTKSFKIQAFRCTARLAMPEMACIFSDSFRRWHLMKHRTNLCRQAPFWTYLITTLANREIWSEE